MKFIRIPFTELKLIQPLIDIKHIIPKPNLDNGPWIAGGVVLKAYMGQSYHKEYNDHTTASNIIAQIIKKQTRNELDAEKSNSTNHISDIDYFFKNESEFFSSLASMAKLHQKRVSTDNAITYDISYNKRYYQAQMINKHYFETVEDVLSSFDFTICQMATDFETVVTTEQTLYDIEHRILRLATGKYNPDNYLKRVLKYSINGFNPEPGLMDYITTWDDELLIKTIEQAASMVNNYGF